MAVLVGQSSSGTNADFFGDGNTAAWKFTASATGNVAVLKFTVKVANPAFTSAKLGIYTDDAANGRPGTLLASGDADVLADARGTGTFSVTLASPQAVTNGTAYWLAIAAAGEQANFQGTTDTTGKEQTGLMPSPYGVPLGGMGSIPAIWGEDASAGAFIRPTTRNPRIGPRGLKRRQRRQQLPGSSPASVDVTINHVVGNLVLSAGTNTPGITLTHTVGNLTLESVAPVVTETFAPTAGVLTLGATAPSIAYGGNVTHIIGDLVLGATAPTVLAGTVITAPIGDLTLGAGIHVPGLALTHTIGNLTLGSSAPVVLQGQFLNPTIGNLLLMAGSGTTVSGGTETGQAPPENRLIRFF